MKLKYHTYTSSMEDNNGRLEHERWDQVAGRIIEYWLDIWKSYHK